MSISASTRSSLGSESTQVADSSTTTIVPANVSLKELGEDPHVRFRSVDELFNEINRTSGDTMIITHVSVPTFNMIEMKRDSRRRKFRLRRYNANRGTLIITIPTAIHEQLHSRLYDTAFKFQLMQMGLFFQWDDKASTRYQSRDEFGRDKDGGEGDSTGGPIPARDGRNQWPTLVIEAGVSQLELRNDMNWWFAASNHDVKIVVLVKLQQSRQQILIEKWRGQADQALRQQGRLQQPGTGWRPCCSKPLL